MNRADRRHQTKLMKSNGDKRPFIEIFRQFIPNIEPIDHRSDEWCHLHQLKLENFEHPTDRDKRLIEEVRYKTLKTPYQIKEDGITRDKIKVEKYCPRCYHTILIDIIDKPLLRI